MRVTAIDEADVLVVGAGPCGITLANLLGSYGTCTVVLEADTDVVPYPRAVGIDDESLRTYQAVGLVERLLADIVQNTPIRYHTSWGKCFAHVKPSVQPFGWPRRNNFLQPLFEQVLRTGAGRFANVDVRYGTRLLALTQDASGVTAQVQHGDAAVETVHARYLVGADGGRSTVRRLTGVELVGETAPEKWLVVDVEDDQLDAPYSAVYCHPRSPVLMVPLPYRHRRFEFKLEPDDPEDAATDPDHVRTLLRTRYRTTPLPRVVSARVYLHHSRIARTFQVGRVFLAGDAAHLQPPFFGQGMNSGIRDATNLAWKLAAVTSGRAGTGLLPSYDQERRAHATEMVSFATRIGRMYRPRNLVTERARDLAFTGLQLLPGGKEYILQMKYKPMPRYDEGIVLDAAAGGVHSPVGRMFTQPVVEAGGRRAKLDEVIGGWFAVLGLHLDPREFLGPQAQAWWRSLGARFVRIDAPRSGPGPAGPVAPMASAGQDDPVTVVEDVDGAFRDWLLASPDREVIVLRPDRYVAAVCDRSGLDAVTARLRSLLEMEEPARAAGGC